MKSSSLARRIVTAVVAVELLCAAAFSGTALWHEERSRFRAFDVMLQGRSDSVLGAVQDAEDPADNVFIDPRELNLPKDDVYAVYNRGGSLVVGSHAASATVSARGGDGFRAVRVGGRAYRVLEREGMRIIDRAETKGAGLWRPVTIVYGAPTAHVWHEIAQAAGFYVVASLLVVGCTTVVLLWLIRKLLQPINELAAAAAQVSPSSLAFVTPETAVRTSELRPLAVTLAETVARLREAFEMEHRFVGDAAHELKTAVAVVRSSIQLLALRKRSAEEYEAGLDRVLADNERVEELVGRMLTLARFEERAQTQGEAIDLADTVRDALTKLSSLAEARRLRLKPSLTGGARVCMAPEAVHTLTSNLVVNAIQHSAPGALIEVRVGVDPETRTSALEVEDQGEGIAEGSLPHVFERFYREDSSRSRNTGGAGLGLAICKNIVEAAGGRIEIASAPGRGTTVRAVFRQF